MNHPESVDDLFSIFSETSATSVSSVTSSSARKRSRPWTSEQGKRDAAPAVSTGAAEIDVIEVPHHEETLLEMSNHLQYRALAGGPQSKIHVTSAEGSLSKNSGSLNTLEGSINISAAPRVTGSHRNSLLTEDERNFSGVDVESNGLPSVSKESDPLNKNSATLLPRHGSTLTSSSVAASVMKPASIAVEQHDRAEKDDFAPNVELFITKPESPSVKANLSSSLPVPVPAQEVNLAPSPSTVDSTGQYNTSSLRQLKEKAEMVSEVVIEKYEDDHNCIFECVCPMDYKRPEKPQIPVAAAKTYEFTLDPFQENSIRCLEQGESVLVSAHTSAGKTVVAEYAIAMSLRDKQRVIYTSPIKALSNQKYRDLSDEFHDVGLMTGDVTLHPNSSIMVMTTEILRSMLYRGSELVRAVKWVIFDEIHYIRDRDRGVVWEESIILLPKEVRLVFLSATIPNALEFAEWICRIKHQPCNVIYTDFRPIPLHHFVFPAGGDGVHLVMDEKKNFKAENLQKAIASLGNGLDFDATQTKQMKKKMRNRTKADIEKIIQLCHVRRYTPVIVFSFSKWNCESNALSMEKIDLLTEDEKLAVEEIFNNAVATLSDEDKELPQVKSMIPLLKRGIGIHHGGLLPLLKEIIEILFQESLLRVLFSTETFSLGVNMPAKTVVFASLRKWDGREYRLLNSGEYIQMAGRAGRRGLDDRGLSIVMLDEQMDPMDAKSIFIGDPLRLDSQFHLGYNMLLNLLRTEGALPEDMIKQSFFQFQTNKSTITLEEKKLDLRNRLTLLNENFSSIDLPNGDAPLKVNIKEEIANYYALKQDLNALGAEMHTLITDSKYISRFLSPGRLIELQGENSYWGWGICCSAVKVKVKAPPTPLVATKTISSSSSTETSADSRLFIIDCLVRCIPSSVRSLKENGIAKIPLPAAESDGLSYGEIEEGGTVEQTEARRGRDISTETSRKRQKLIAEDSLWEVLPFTIQCAKSISQIRLNLPPDQDLCNEETKKVVAYQFEKVKTIYGSYDKLPLLDPIEDMGIEMPRLPQLIEEIKTKEKHLMANPFWNFKHTQLYYDKYRETIKLTTEIRECEDSLHRAKHMVMKDDLRGMRRVLRKLDYIDRNGVVSLKGRVACEISAADELVTAELLFQNFFYNLDIEYVVAILSSLVYDEKNEEGMPNDPPLVDGLAKIKEIARRVGEVSIESKLPLVMDEYLEKFKESLMIITLRWMKGAKFVEAIQGTSLFEGSVIRSMRRNEELLRQLACASKEIGDDELEKKFLDGILKLKRGIVFSPSLFL